MGKLDGTRVYLVGAMDRAPDGGKGWREEITPPLQEMGIHVLSPCKKPIDIGLESEDGRKKRKEHKRKGEWDELAKYKTIRSVDLRMVDISDFIIVALNMEEHPFGTIEEIVTANRQKKVILVWAVNGKAEAPDWLFWMIPHKFIFDKLEDLLKYVKDVDSGNREDKRWVIFDFDGEEKCLI